MIRGAKLFVKGYDGTACGPFRWTAVREWVAIGYFTPADEVRLVDEAAWTRIETLPELVPTPSGYYTNEPLNFAQERAREKKVIGARAAAYLQRLGCPVPPPRLNPYTALQWVKILEELRPHLADATESWAAEEEANDRVPSASPRDATREQIEFLRSAGHDVPVTLTRLDARRLLSGPPTEGQLRRLRFYGVTLPVGACKAEASEQIDRYMREHWETEEAYQAARKRLITEAAERRKPADEWAIRPSPKPGLNAAGAPSTAPTRTPAPTAAPSVSAPPPRRRAVTPHVMVSLLVVLGLILVAWFVLKPGTGAGPTPPTAAPASPDQIKAPPLRAFAMSLKLTGIVGGPEPWALINDRKYLVGDVIDPSRGIVVLHVNADKRSVTFGDREGNIFERMLP
jgi:hypothetical protein